MCYVQIIMAAVAVVGSLVQSREQNKAAEKSAKALEVQRDQRNEEIADAASVELNERTRAVRRARASARATASESGINLSSGSFLAQLMTLDVQQDMNVGLVNKDARNKTKATDAEYKAAHSRIQFKSGLGIATEAVGAGLNAYSGSGGTFGRGATQSWTPIGGGS